MRTYNQLNQAQRYQIEVLKKAGKENKELAGLIETSAATISRELRRNGGESGYDAQEAYARAEQRKRQGRKPTKITAEVIQQIRKGLLFDHSPEQVSGALKVEHGISVSHEWIYQYIARDKQEGGDLYNFPKGSSFDDITEQDVNTVMYLLNQRPRKTLNYQTPHAVFFAENERKAA